uniref:Uncharacterized protein n=1 Tax=Rousettus aegyptiacus TaxID=9407 RepID=A0A7J8C256_ROUAE|nr:hypothetical protein HJG63_009268 [Rousettus aegyptiacus]
MLCPDGLEMNVLLPGPSHFLSRFLSRSSQPPDEAAQRGRAGEGLPATWPPSPRLRPAPPAPTGRVGPHCVIRAPRVSGSSDKSSSPAFAHLEAVRLPPSYFVRREKAASQLENRAIACLNVGRGRNSFSLSFSSSRVERPPAGCRVLCKHCLL